MSGIAGGINLDELTADLVELDNTNLDRITAIELQTAVEQIDNFINNTRIYHQILGNLTINSGETVLGSCSEIQSGETVEIKPGAIFYILP